MKFTIYTCALIVLTMTAVFNTTRIKSTERSSVVPKKTFDTKDGLKEYIKSVVDEKSEFPLGKDKDGKVKDDELDKVDWKKISELKSFPVKLSWDKVRKLFSKSAEEKKTMIKFLTLRAMDVKKSILETLKSKTLNDKEKYTIEGNNENFTIKNLKVRFAPTKTYHHLGNMNIAASGSMSFTSDIDFTLDFKEDKNKSEYTELAAVSIFINQFNNIFYKNHKVSSSISYDVNLYSRNFGYGSLISAISSLTKTNKEIFSAANRLSVLLLIYNDSLHKFSEKFEKAKEIKKKEIVAALNNLLAKSSPKDYKCGELLLTPNPEKAIRTPNKIDTIRDDNFEKRNKSMSEHLILAGQTSSNKLNNLCHVLAANYYALEAYVPYGSVFEMGRVYGFVKSKNDLVNKLKQNSVIDSILMNFAYCVEHYFHATTKGEQSDEFANKFFTKYAARIYKIFHELEDVDHKTCWNDAFENAGLLEKKDAKVIPTNTPELKSLAEKFKKVIVSKTDNIDADSNIIVKFVTEGYKCVEKYSLSLVKEN